MGFLLGIRYAGPGAEADAEPDAAYTFKVQLFQGIDGLIELFVVRRAEGQDGREQGPETHVQASVFQQKGNAVRQSFITLGKYPEKFLKRFRRLGHERHDERPEYSVADAYGVAGNQFSLTGPELCLEIRVQHVMQPVRPACVGVRQTQRQGIAGYERPPVPTGHFRGNAQADVTQSLMGRKGMHQQVNLTESVHHAGQKTVMGVMQRSYGAGYLLTSRNRRHLGHGGIAFLQGCFPQGIRQNGGPCPKNEPAGFQSAVALQRGSPVIQQRADMKAQILCRQPGRTQKFGNSGSAAFRVVLKNDLKQVPRLGKGRLEFFRQTGNNAPVFFYAHMLQGTLKTQKTHETSVVRHQNVVINRFQSAVTVHRSGEDFRDGAYAAVYAIDKFIQHQDSLFRTTC